MVSKSTSLNSGGRASVFSFPMTDWNALLRLSLFTLLMTMVGLSRTQAQCTLMYNDPSMDVELTVDAMGNATLDAAALMPLVTVTGAGCTDFVFYDALGSPLTAAVTIGCSAGDPNGPGTYLATVTDGTNLSNTVTFTVVLMDNIDPTFTVPADIAISCEDSQLPANTGMVTGISDNCATGLIASSTDDVTGLTGCNGTGTIVRTWTVDDGNGNSVSQDQTITVQDVTSPTFDVPADAMIDCDDDITDLTITGDATMEMDNCSMGIDATYLDAAPVAVMGGCPGEVNIERTWTLVDDCNNATQLVQTITVKDMTGPTSTLTVAAVDNNPGVCVGSVEVIMDATNTSDSCSAFADLTITNDYNAGGANASDTYPVGTTTVTFTIVDQCMNSSTHMVDVTVNDNTAPTIVDCPADITVDNDPMNCDNTVSWTAPTVSDNCMGTITEEILVSDPSVVINTGTPGPGRVDFADFPVGTSQVRYAFKDANGVSDTCTFLVTVLDTEKPNIICPADQTIDFGGCNAANELVPDYRSLLAVSDNCSNGFTVTQSPVQNTPLSGVTGVTPADGETFMVTLTATDNSANNLDTSCVIMVTMNENGSITPETPGVNLPTINETCGTVEVCAPTAFDECGNLLAATPNPGAGAVISGVCSPPCTQQPTVSIPVGQPINDNTAVGTNYTIAVSGVSGLIDDMDFQLEINHTWVGDLEATLTSPDGTTTIDLMDRPGFPAGFFGCANDNLNVTFDDESANTLALLME